MRFHPVEVDDDVFEFVKGKAEPLVDTFNSALRRILPIDSRHKGPTDSSKFAQDAPANGPSILPSLSSGIPQALRQILEVARLVRGGAYTRTAATSFIAKQHRVFPQTVLDKYCRQLGLTAREFDRLLEPTDAAELRKLLKLRFPGYDETVDEMLG
jgi:hypothetical protein